MGNEGEETGLEPSSVLVGALQVDVCGISAVTVRKVDLGPAGAAVEPHVHGIGSASVAGPRGVSQSWWDPRLVAGVVCPPCVNATLFDDIHDVGHAVLREQSIAGTAVVERRDRDTPGALTRDTPFAAVLDEVLQSLSSGSRHEVDILESCHGAATDVGYVGEPLLCGADDDGKLGPPVVGILVFVPVLGDQQAPGFNVFENSGVSITQDALSTQPCRVAGHGLVGEFAVVVHGGESRDTSG